LLSEVTKDVDVEQALLLSVDHVDVINANTDVVSDVNLDVNKDNPEQVLLTVVTKDVDVEQALLVNMDRVDVNTETVENADGDVDTETMENAEVNNGNVAGNANKTKVRSVEALMCELQRARDQELLRAREREVLDIFSELPYQVTQKMSGNLDRGNSCPLYTQGNGFRL
jgi:hypothetical protein